MIDFFETLPWVIFSYLFGVIVGYLVFGKTRSKKE